MRPKKTLYNWLTTGFLLIIRNEENFAEKRTFSFNYAKLIVLLLTFFVLTFGICFYLSTTLLAMWFDPRNYQLEMNRNLILLSAQVDSLEMEMNRKDTYIASVNRTISGNDSKDTIKGSTTGKPALKSTGTDLDQLSQEDVELRKQFESQEPGTVFLERGRYGELSESFFLTPVNGKISAGYNPSKEHNGVDIVTEKDATVKAVADGSVIYASFSLDGGNIIVIQHKNNLLSVYKHNASLFKKEGDVVKGGDVIAVVGNTGEMTNGPHLHFELWYNGSPVDPQHFVTF